MVDELRAAASLPRSVLVADGRLYRQISESPNSVGLLEDRDAMIIPYSGSAAVNEAEVAAVRKLLAQSGQLAPGSLFVRNPYTVDTFEIADGALEAFAMAKYHVLANVAKHLGATKVSFVDARVDHVDSSSKGEIKAKAPVLKAEAAIGRDVTQKIASRLQGEMTFAGSAPDIDEAMECLRVRNLLSDQQLLYLVDLRTGKNPVGKYKMTLSGTRESAANLKSALVLAAALPKTVDGAITFTMTANSISSIEITTEITF